MKREILCPTCHKLNEKLISACEPDCGEHTKIVEGLAIDNFVCDRCNSILTVGSFCAASSIWFENHGIPYYPWEQDYITIQRISDVGY